MAKPAISGRKVAWENEKKALPKLPSFLDRVMTQAEGTPNDV